MWYVYHMRLSNVLSLDCFLCRKNNLPTNYQRNSKILGNKNIEPNIIRFQAYNLTIYWYFDIWFTDFMLNNKSWTDVLVYLYQWIKKKYMIEQKILSEIVNLTIKEYFLREIYVSEGKSENPDSYIKSPGFIDITFSYFSSYMWWYNS